MEKLIFRTASDKRSLRQRWKIKANLDAFTAKCMTLIKSNYRNNPESQTKRNKNSSGYYLWNAYDKETDTLDLSKVVVGSQGTLAVVASATITGVKPKSHSRMVVMFVPSTAHLGEIIPKFLEYKPETLESYDDNTFKIAMKFFKDIALRMGGNMFTLGFSFLPEFWMALTGGVPKIILMAEFTGDSEDGVESQAKSAYEAMKAFNLPLKMTHSEQEAKKYWTFRRESFNLLRSRLKGIPYGTHNRRHCGPSERLAGISAEA
jgi:FAD/FMN-containing dehydrogenase